MLKKHVVARPVFVNSVPSYAYLANNYYFCSRNRMRAGWWHLREVQNTDKLL